MEIAVVVALILLIVGFLAWTMIPRPHLVLMIRGGQIEVYRGKVSQPFLSDLKDAIKAIPDSEIHGFRRGGRMELTFSVKFPDELEQRVRNLWSLHMGE